MESLHALPEKLTYGDLSGNGLCLSGGASRSANAAGMPLRVGRGHGEALRVMAKVFLFLNTL